MSCVSVRAIRGSNEREEERENLFCWGRVGLFAVICKNCSLGCYEGLPLWPARLCLSNPFFSLLSPQAVTIIRPGGMLQQAARAQLGRLGVRQLPPCGTAGSLVGQARQVQGPGAALQGSSEKEGQGQGVIPWLFGADEGWNPSLVPAGAAELTRTPLPGARPQGRGALACSLRSRQVAAGWQPRGAAAPRAQRGPGVGRQGNGRGCR